MVQWEQVSRAYLRFYAELNDFLPPERRFRDIAYDFDVSGALKDVVEGFGVPHTEVDLILVNGESSDFARPVRDGDRISVYPVFESIDITPVLRVRPEPLREPRFVLDIHLGRLARYLRMLGFDAVYDTALGDSELAAISRDETRILLTRDRGLLKRADVTHGYCVRETDYRGQVAEVLQRFDLRGAVDPFTRCLRCNRRLRPAKKEALGDRVPPHAAERHCEFRECPGCGRVYWEGSHHERMQRFVRGLG